jgi:hypothetical protein
MKNVLQLRLDCNWRINPLYPSNGGSFPIEGLIITVDATRLQLDAF